MEMFTMTLICAMLTLLVVPMETMPTPQETNDGKNEPVVYVTPNNQKVELVPVAAVVQKKDGELLDTANASYYYRPVYSFRRVQENRRRVYTPRRRYTYDRDVDRFPTVA